MKIFGSIQELVSLVYRKGSSQITLRPNSGTTYAADRAVDLPPGDSAHVLVSETATQSLTNKTINVTVGNNSISNLPITSLLTVLADANKVLLRDSSGAVISGAISNANIDAAANIALTKLATVTASRALASDGSGNISASSITATELGHLSGVTSNIQTQLDNKVDENPAIVGATATKITFDSKGLVTAGTALAAGDLPSGIDATKIGAGSVDNTEFGYLNGLASSAVGVSDSQTLLNKQISSTAAITGALTLPSGSEGQRPGSPVDGMVRYNTDSGSFEGRANGNWSGIGGGGTTDLVTQASHGFAAGDVLYLNGSTYTKAIASAANTAEVVGIVSRVVSASQFEMTLSGEISGLIASSFAEGTLPAVGETLFLSDSVAGKLTITEPSTIGYVSIPVGVVSESVVGPPASRKMYVAIKRGSVVGSSNARTQIALANNATTTVQGISAYDAGELTGWVSITATTPLRFYVAAQFSKNGAANNYNISYQVSGDTPPTGFSVTATAAGLLQVTLPSVTGFASATINYALNAPAVGTSFPLSVQSSSIVWSEPVAFRNKIINGNFDIWQRATTQTSNGYGSSDRWYNEHGGSSKTTSRQLFTVGQTDVPNNPQYFTRTVVTSVAGATNNVIMSQLIESVRTFAGKTVTLSFWAKADANKNIAVEYAQNFGTGGSPSARVTGIGIATCALTTSWQKFTLTTTIPSISGKTLGTDENHNLQMAFWFDAGSSFNSRTNSLGQQSGTFDIAQVQLEEGSIATPFEQRPIGTELALCQRYYYRIPAANSYVVASIYDAGGRCVGMWPLPVTMRAIPVFQNVGTSTISYVDTGGNATPVTTFVTKYESTNMVAVNVAVSGRTTVGSTNLLTPTAGVVIGAEAEL